MGFLHEQLGEDELRHLLERLNAWNEEEEANPINVADLMHLTERSGGALGPRKDSSAKAEQ